MTDDTEQSDTVLACPDCDRASVQHASPDTYECQVCKATFDKSDAVERDRRGSHGIRSDSLAAQLDDVDLYGIDWAIIGGESGADSRRRGMDPDWARQLIYQCRTNDVDVFFKQHSGRYPEDDISIELAGQQQRIEQFPDLPDGVAPAPQEFRDRDAEVIIG